MNQYSYGNAMFYMGQAPVYTEGDPDIVTNCTSYVLGPNFAEFRGTSEAPFVGVYSTIGASGGKYVGEMANIVKVDGGKWSARFPIADGQYVVGKAAYGWGLSAPSHAAWDNGGQWELAPENGLLPQPYGPDFIPDPQVGDLRLLWPSNVAQRYSGSAWVNL